MPSELNGSIADKRSSMPKMLRLAAWRRHTTQNADASALETPRDHYDGHNRETTTAMTTTTTMNDDGHSNSNKQHTYTHTCALP